MAGDVGEHDADGLTPGEEIADQERSYFDNRRHIQDLDDDEAGRRERSRLRVQERKMHLRVRTHRTVNRQDPGPLPRDLVLPPFPNHEDAQRDWRD